MKRKLQSPTDVPGRFWTDVAKLGTVVLAEGDQPEIPFTPRVVGQIMANFKRRVIPRPPVKKQHESDGLVRGDIYAMRLDRRPDGTWLQALIDLKDPKDRRAYNLNMLREFSPMVHLNWSDPHLGVDYGAVISELSYVTEPGQLTLRTPQAINPGVTLSRKRPMANNFSLRRKLARELRKLQAEDEEKAALQAEEKAEMQSIPEPDQTVAELRAQVADLGRRLADMEEGATMAAEENALAGDHPEEVATGLELIETETGATDASPTTITDEEKRELQEQVAEMGRRLAEMEDRPMAGDEPPAAALARTTVQSPRGRAAGPKTRPLTAGQVPKAMERRGLKRGTAAYYTAIKNEYGEERGAEILAADRDARRLTAQK